jgi:hypothetical protein
MPAENPKTSLRASSFQPVLWIEKHEQYSKTAGFGETVPFFLIKPAN